MAAHFGAMLQERRRALGMSIQQVANTIKIRPQIIEFFETENLAAMPPRGYAQGMISSYARFLGLNPRVVVDAYFDALNAYEHGAGPGRRYQEYVPDASPRSSNATGRFLMVGGPSAASSRYVQRPPQAGYVSEGGSPHEPIAAEQLRPLSAAGARGARRANTVNGGSYGPASSDVTGRLPVQNGYPSRGMVPAGPARGQHARSEGYGSDRPVSGGRAPMPRGNRGGSRGGQGMPPRGGVSRGGAGSVPPRRGQNGGYRGSGSNGGFSLDPRTLLIIIAVLLAIIVLLGVLVLRGCAPAGNASDTGSAAPKAQAADQADDDSTTEDTGTDEPAADDEGADPAAPATEEQKAAEEPKETKVKVAIKEKGAVAFLEIKLDGKSVFGAQQVGPFEQEFTVTQEIEITTDKPSDVTVTKNGEKVRYDMKVSGVAKVTITAPKQEETKTEEGAEDGTQPAEGTDTTDPAAAQ